MAYKHAGPVVIVTAATILCLAAMLGGFQSGYAFAYPNPENKNGGSGANGDSRLAEVRKNLDALYQKAASAAHVYNMTDRQAQEQSDRIAEISEGVVEVGNRLTRLKILAGARARDQYRTNGLPFQVHIFLAGTPAQFLEGLRDGYKSTLAVNGLLDNLNRANSELSGQKVRADRRRRELVRLRNSQAAAEREVRKRIAAAESLEDSLELQDRLRLQNLQRVVLEQAQGAWLASGTVGRVDEFARRRAERALEYATAQIGKPYEWGAEGPNSYDCSGLTSQAWRSAGVPMPRTSQEQWSQLPHVEISEVRPGDLIIYNRDTSHVAIYVGGGMIVHAPRPGRNVTLAGIKSMEILGAVRPGVS
ncbi:C40 family peptidase [Streptomyces sp. NPDC057686]|uniref:C40 family peptidase n=1 Tax=Streptomyces sp. NPDC057686 TaxID=3346212 RepID=UPI0036AB83A9